MAEIKRILVTGAVGQIGSELTLSLRERYGADNVVACGRKTEPSPELRDSGPFDWCDVTDRAKLTRLSGIQDRHDRQHGGDPLGHRREEPAALPGTSTSTA